MDGKLTHALHHDWKKSSLLLLGGQYRLCHTSTAGPMVQPFPQPGEKPLGFGAAAADVKLHCPRCTGDSGDSG